MGDKDMTKTTEILNDSAGVPHSYRVTRDDNGTIISQIAADPVPPMPVSLSKLEYRALFTLAERIAIDNFAANAGLTDIQKATLNTIHYDFQLANDINLSDPYTIQGTQLLESYGLIAAGRAAQILANTPAPA